MLAIARRRRGAERVRWVLDDALHLPFATGAFDAAVSGFLLRNVTDVDAALMEQRRVLRPGAGRLLCLDTTPPRPSPLRPLLEFHLNRVIPALGRWIAGDAEAYNYLPGSTRRFISAEDLAERMRRAGFAHVGFVRRMFGTVAIHWGSLSRGDA
jgi:demethylmenaquinone methyltransferase/2-methoxy-6-polyprenyl-1,4-benzoquinol methylase